MQLLSLQPRISNVFSRWLEHFFLTVGQNNFGNKIPFFLQTISFLLTCRINRKSCTEHYKEVYNRTFLCVLLGKKTVWNMPNGNFLYFVNRSDTVMKKLNFPKAFFVNKSTWFYKNGIIDKNVIKKFIFLKLNYNSLQKIC